MNRHWSRKVAACTAASAALLVASAASAQTRGSASNWRQTDRSSVARDERFGSPQSFAFELRFGPYSPEVDEEEALAGAAPYRTTFGDVQQFYFGLELDWLPLRVPYVGLIGPGVGWGYTSKSTGAFAAGTTTKTDEQTSLTVMPMHLSAVARFDELMRRTGIPIVPYAKAGLGMGLWYSVSGPRAANVDGVRGEGITWGTHLALGGALALNWLDRRSSSQLDESTGINHTYLFGEWMYANLDGLGSSPQMHVGTSTWVLGLALDM
ncbi:MXAN_2562 family outer membrane beta-barrel protein [Sorangium sp. So ce1182]|uniref:MXAN_2562 family outer membrane beta-barrel protein n=1 Tax=Sorangium sp. So ce1182 TaxID=3133334 RepID=UPI003F616599